MTPTRYKKCKSCGGKGFEETGIGCFPCFKCIGNGEIEVRVRRLHDFPNRRNHGFEEDYADVLEEVIESVELLGDVHLHFEGCKDLSEWIDYAEKVKQDLPLYDVKYYPNVKVCCVEGGLKRCNSHKKNVY